MTKRSVALVGVLIVMAMIGSSVIGAVSAIAASDTANGSFSVFLPLILNAIGAMAEVPQGAVMTFNLTSCPSGWTEVTDAQGRAIVGLPSGGTLAGTVSTALTNLESVGITDVPSHQHGIDPPAYLSEYSGVHSHSVDPPPESSSSIGSHQHWINPGAASSSSAGSHNHTIGGGTTFTGTGNAMVTGDHATNLNSSSGGDHSHSFDIPGFNSFSDGSHSHSVDLSPFSSSSAGNHAHTVDIDPFDSDSTGISTVDVTIPYIQFLVCQKD